MTPERKMLWDLLRWLIEQAEDWDGATEQAHVDGQEIQAFRDDIVKALREGELDEVD